MTDTGKAVCDGVRHHLKRVLRRIPEQPHAAGKAPDAERTQSLDQGAQSEIDGEDDLPARRRDVKRPT
jgi:hypothetical protein